VYKWNKPNAQITLDGGQPPPLDPDEDVSVAHLDQPAHDVGDHGSPEPSAPVARVNGNVADFAAEWEVVPSRPWVMERARRSDRIAALDMGDQECATRHDSIDEALPRFVADPFVAVDECAHGAQVRFDAALHEIPGRQPDFRRLRQPNDRPYHVHGRQVSLVNLVGIHGSRSLNS